MVKLTGVNIRIALKANSSRWLSGLLVVVCFFFLLLVRLVINNPITGDEPHYLSMDYAMIHSHSLNLKEVYDSKEYSSYFSGGKLVPQAYTVLLKKNPANNYSIHGFGLPILLLFPFYIAKQNGAIIAMISLATLTVVLVWVWAHDITKSKLAAYTASAVLAISYFFSGLAGSIYPDIPIAATTLSCLIILYRRKYSYAYQIIFGILLALLVFLHFKNLIIAGPLAAAITFLAWKEEKRKIVLIPLLLLIFGTAFYELKLHQWFGVWSIAQTYPPGGASFNGNIFNNISSMLFDANRGLLIYCPSFLLLFLGLPIWWHHEKRSILLTLVATLPSIGMLIIFSQWNGGYAPVGRYLMEILPIFVPAIAFAIQKATSFWRRFVAIALSLISLGITIDAMVEKFPLLNQGLFYTTSGLVNQLWGSTGFSLDHFLPRYSNNTELLSTHGWIKLLICYLVLAAFLVYGWYSVVDKEALKDKITAIKLRQIS